MDPFWLHTGQLVDIKQLLETLKEQLNMPARSIQAEHFLSAPLLGAKGGDDDQPACEIQGLSRRLALLAPLARFLELAFLSGLPLLLG